MEFTLLYLIFCFIFGIIFDFNSLACCLLMLFVCLLCDTYNVWTFSLLVLVSKIRRRYQPKQLVESTTYYSFCTLFDVDYNLRLTEESLHRKCDIAHAQFFTENSVNYALNTLVAKMHLKQKYTEYILQIRVFERFEILTKIIYWDKSIIYVKQSIIRNSDNFRCAVVYSMFHISGATTSALLEKIDVGDDYVKQPIRTELVQNLQGLKDDVLEKT